MAKKKKIYLVTVKLVYDEDDLKKAMEWSNRKRYTYVRDKEYASMLFAAECAGVVNSAGIEDSNIEEY